MAGCGGFSLNRLNQGVQQINALLALGFQTGSDRAERRLPQSKVRKQPEML